MPAGFHEIQVKDTPLGKLVHLTFNEKLSKDDHDQFVPILENVMDRGERIRLLVELRSVSSWTAPALLEEVRFGLQHSDGIEKLAVVGDGTRLGRPAMRAKPATEMKFFRRRCCGPCPRLASGAIAAAFLRPSGPFDISGTNRSGPVVEFDHLGEAGIRAGGDAVVERTGGRHTPPHVVDERIHGFVAQPVAGANRTSGIVA